MPLRLFTRLTLIGSLLAGFPPFTARALEPFAAYVFPAGGQRGTTVALRVGGCYFHGEAGFEMLGPGLDASTRVKETNTVWFEGPVISQPASQRSEDYPRDHAGSVRITADAPAGLRYWRAWTSQGATPAMKFVVGELPELVEVEAEGEPLPVMVATPITINGRIFPREDADVWTFKARAGQTFTLAVAAQSLGSPLQARLVVFDANGRPLAEAIATQRGDPVLPFTAPSDGTYRVRIDDVNAGGLQNHVYRLTISDQPFIGRVFPLGGKAGESLKVELTGNALPANTGTVQLPKASTSGTVRVAVQAGGKSLGQVAMELDDLPEQVHAPTAESFTVPTVLNGRVFVAGATNRWRFTAKKGDALELSLAAPRLGSPLTPMLLITDATGTALARSEGAPGELADLALAFKAPADGEFSLQISERFATRGGPDFAYRLRVAPVSAPDFRLSLASDTVTVLRETADGEAAPGKPKRGGKQQPGKLKVNATAIGGFKGDIELSVEGLPANVTVSGTKIASGRPTTDLSFAAEHLAKIRVAELTVRGTATINGTPVTRTATLPVARGELPIESVLLAVALPTPFKNTSEFLMTIAQRGSTYRRPYGLERGGFTGPLVARLADRQGRHLQGVTAPPVHIPAGAEQFEFMVTLAPGMELGRTSRSQVMLLGTVRDHDGSEHIVSYSQNEQNDQLIAITQTGLLEIELANPSVRVMPGGSVKLPFLLRREKSLAADAVQVELQVPAHVRGVRSATVTIAGGSQNGILEIHFAADAGPFNLPFPIRATTLDAKNPHTAEAFVEFVTPTVVQTVSTRE